MSNWNIVHESDDENGNPTLWATEINHDTYGRFAWIVKENDNCFSVEINNKGDEFTSLAKCNSLNNAKRWVYSNIGLPNFSCPTKNGDFEIIKHEEITDVDGTILGTALAKSQSQYATWEYCYFPETNYFNGFNTGHYFIDELEAVNDFYKRCSSKSESVIKAKSFYKEVTSEQLEKLKQSDLIFEKSVKDGQIIVKVDRSDGEKLNAILKDNKSVKL